MAERPSVAAPSLAWRRSGRAGAHGRRYGVGRHRHQAREGAGCRPHGGAGVVCPLTRGRRRSRVRASCRGRVPAPGRGALEPGSCVPRAGWRGDLRGQDHTGRPTARPRSPRARAGRSCARAVSAHRRARRAPRTRRDGMEGEGSGRRLVRAASRCSRTVAAAWRTTHGFAGCVRKPRPGGRVRRAPARVRGRRLRRPRPAHGRSGARRSGIGRSRRGSRTGRSSASGRSTTSSRSSGAGACPVSTRPVRAALRLGAYQLGYVDGVARYAAVNESVELVRRAGLERAVAFTNAVLRRLEQGIGPVLDSLGDDSATAAALRHSYPDWVAETWWRDLGAEDARALMRALNEPGADRCPARSRRSRRHRRHRRPRRMARRAGRRASARGGADLAAERGVAARRPRASVRARASGRSISARLRAGRPRCSPARSSPWR